MFPLYHFPYTPMFVFIPMICLQRTKVPLLSSRTLISKCISKTINPYFRFSFNKLKDVCLLVAFFFSQKLSSCNTQLHNTMIFLIPLEFGSVWLWWSDNRTLRFSIYVARRIYALLVQTRGTWLPVCLALTSIFFCKSAIWSLSFGG